MKPRRRLGSRFMLTHVELPQIVFLKIHLTLLHFERVLTSCWTVKIWLPKLGLVFCFNDTVNLSEGLLMKCDELKC